MRTAQLRRAGIFAVLVFAVASSGCATMSNAEKGAIGGGVVGTAAGTAIGAATGDPLLGAGIGAATGTLGGALLGKSIDRDERREREINQAAAVAAAQAQQRRMGIADVMDMAQKGHDDQVIINQIRSTGSTFQLNGSDLDMLKNSGVSARVIAEMQAARPVAAPGRVVVREQPTVIYGAPPYYVRPAPVIVVPRHHCHPRPYYSAGIHYHWR
ncbi:MAG: DUF1269 domain-containing protein [Planctomycetia bacterium]|nr:DUF1269 domain-containing protein [Planctomycetia bacterium]